MTVTINGTTGVTTPGLNSTGSNTLGDNVADTLNVGNGAIVTDASGNVGIGTSSPSLNLQVKAATPIIGAESASWTTGASAELRLSYVATDARAIKGHYDNGMTFHVNGERMRIDSSGNLLVGITDPIPTNNATGTSITSGSQIRCQRGATGVYIGFYNTSNSALIGSISNNGGTATTYSTSSDYRLKENIQPMQNALGVVAQLNPVTYTWKADGSDGQGFIAHELQAVVPDCVTGEKDAVDDEGNPVYQGIDTSFLVATLTKAIQELKAEVDELKAKVTA
jgi:hypothetical protein